MKGSYPRGSACTAIDACHLFQHRGIRGRVGDVSGALSLAAGAGADQVGGRIYQLVPSDEDQTYNHWKISGGQRSERAILSQPVSNAQHYL